MRVQFNKYKQREFLKRVLEKTNCPSLKELINRGIEVNYSTLKNYFNEERLIPEKLFDELIALSGLEKKDFKFNLVDEHWGQAKGGRISKVR